jgi:arsenate reductase
MDDLTVYGIPNCDTVKRTMDWLRQHKIVFSFHDYKKEGISKEKLTEWCKQVGWEIFLNKKSATWRGLPAPVQKKVTSQATAIDLMTRNTSIIKRPVIESGHILIVGFTETEYIKQLKKKK